MGLTLVFKRIFHVFVWSNLDADTAFSLECIVLSLHRRFQYLFVERGPESSWSGRFLTGKACYDPRHSKNVWGSLPRKLLKTVLIWCMLHMCGGHGRPQGGKNGNFSTPWKLELRSKNSRKRKISSFLPISWVNSGNDSLFAGMTFTLHKSQFTVLV